MQDQPATPLAAESVPYKNTGHPLRDWVAWKIANTAPGAPVFPVIHAALAALIPLLLKMVVGQVSTLAD